MTEIKIGKLRERVSILKKIFSLNTEGNYEENWERKAEIWAAVTPFCRFSKKNYKEWDCLDEEKFKRFYRVTVRQGSSRNTLQEKCEALLWKNKILNIFYPFYSIGADNLLEAVVVEQEKGEGTW